MSHADPLLMLADVAQVASERPDLDEALVRAIYRHQVENNDGRQPTIQQARDYIDHLTSHVDEETIRSTLRTLGLSVPRRARTRPRVTAVPLRPKDHEVGAAGIVHANADATAFYVGGGEPQFVPPSRRIDRYRLPGWSDLAEIAYLAQHAPPMAGRNRPGRPPGPYLIQTRAEIEAAYRKVWSDNGRRPYWSEVARALGVDERTLRHARHDFGLDGVVIEQAAG